MDPISDSTIRYVWASFDSDGTITGSKDIASVTKNGTGDFTITYTGVMQTDNYAVSITPIDTSTAPITVKNLAQDEVSCRFICRGGAVQILGINIVSSAAIDPSGGINFFACT